MRFRLEAERWVSLSRRGGSYSPTGAALLASAVTVVCVLPTFLVGAMAVQISTELALSTSTLGLAIGISRGSGAGASAPLGRLADRIGTVWSLRLAMVIAALSSLGIFLTVVGVKSLVAWLVVAGSANALGQPAANRLLARVVRPGRLGAAFGVKQSAPPAALMLAGFCVPLVALTAGWRWAFFLGAAAAGLVILAVGRRPSEAARSPRVSVVERVSRRETAIYTVAFGFGTAASSAATAFYVASAVASGTSPSTAGLILAVASCAAVLARLISGWGCDRMATGHLRMCAYMLGVGCVGYAFLAVGNPNFAAMGIIVALAGSWGFNGVFWFALVRAYSAVPGAITGALAPGGLLGAAVGPIAFGYLAEHATYETAWMVAGVMSAMAAWAMVLGDRRL